MTILTKTSSTYSCVVVNLSFSKLQALPTCVRSETICTVRLGLYLPFCIKSTVNKIHQILIHIMANLVLHDFCIKCGFLLATYCTWGFSRKKYLDGVGGTTTQI